MFEQLPPVLRDLSVPLRLRLWNGQQFDLGPDPQVTLVVKDPKLVGCLTHPTLDALGGAYIEGNIDIEGPIEKVIEVGDVFSRAVLGDQRESTAGRGVHDRFSDAESIHYHYDLSNDFYQLWLDPEMIYSCGYFETGRETLAQAQQAKMRHLCRKLRLQAGEWLLDIGCGWGGLARFAAREFGVRVHGITLSKEQLGLARQRVHEDGLDGQVELELRDYRDLPEDGRYDKIVSVGMLEHVGHDNLPQYCHKVFAALRPGGLAMNHGITARHTDETPVGRGAGEFIARYVFPNGELPHLATMVGMLSNAGLEVVDVESLRLHYARTLDGWSRNLEDNLEQAGRMVSAQALRTWRLYLAGCAYGFRRNWTNIHQILSVKPRKDGSHDLPWTRADLYR